MDCIAHGRPYPGQAGVPVSPSRRWSCRNENGGTVCGGPPPGCKQIPISIWRISRGIHRTTSAVLV
jgi:hypothetical protein